MRNSDDIDLSKLGDKFSLRGREKMSLDFCHWQLVNGVQDECTNVKFYM